MKKNTRKKRTQAEIKAIKKAQKMGVNNVCGNNQQTGSSTYLSSLLNLSNRTSYQGMDSSSEIIPSTIYDEVLFKRWNVSKITPEMADEEIEYIAQKLQSIPKIADDEKRYIVVPYNLSPYPFMQIIDPIVLMNPQKNEEGVYKTEVYSKEMYLKFKDICMSNIIKGIHLGFAIIATPKEFTYYVFSPLQRKTLIEAMEGDFGYFYD